MFVAERDDLQAERLSAAVSRVMAVRDVTVGRPEQGFIVRYRGRLLIDSAEAFDALEPLFHRAGMTLLLKEEEGDHVFLAIPGLPEPRASNPWLNLALFVATLFTVLLTGAGATERGAAILQNEGLWPGFLHAYREGIPFALSLLGILLAHEFGHYLAARYHKTPVTLPYFIPFPGNILGTMGAFIRLKAPPKNRRILLDIGIAGPLAGLVIAIPVLLYGLSLSQVTSLPRDPSAVGGLVLEGNSLLYLAAKYVVKGELLPAPADYGGVSPLLYWIRYFFVGLPAPLGGRDVLLHPVAWAGWAGLLVTALNLIPAGQLDGGHVIYTLFGRHAGRIRPFILFALVVLGMIWPGWLLWAMLILVLGRYHAQPLDEVTPLNPARRALAYLGLVVLILVFVPIPLRGFL
jgi:membrane-associated protease RseP (regulator of RpoE activity)